MSELTLTLQREIEQLKQKNTTLYHRVKNLNRNKLRLKKTINSQQKLIQHLSQNESELNTTESEMWSGESILQKLNEWEDANELLESCNTNTNTNTNTNNNEN
jgi:DNA repair exonuclease SbcCD ATPase subunit